MSTEQAAADSSDESVTMTELLSNFEKPKPTAAELLLRHAITHFVVAISALSLWAAADTWYLLTQLPVANFLSISTAVVAAVVVSTVVHEWFHYAGAKFSGASYRIPAQLGLFVYDFDFGKSTVRQFNIMSWAGQVGSLVAVLGVVALVPMDNSGRLMLLAATIGSAIFGGIIEWPVLLRTRQSQNPLQELSLITPAVINKGMLIGSGSGALIWLAMA